MASTEAEWQRCKAWIEDALVYTGGSHTIEDIEEGIAAQKLMLIPGAKSALVFELLDAPKMRIFNIFLGGGDLSELRSMNDFVDALACAYGCRRIMITGRGGWARELRDLGYVARHVVLAKELA